MLVVSRDFDNHGRYCRGYGYLFFQRLHLITTAKMNISQRWTIIWKVQ